MVHLLYYFYRMRLDKFHLSFSKYLDPTYNLAWNHQHIIYRHSISLSLFLLSNRFWIILYRDQCLGKSKFLVLQVFLLPNLLHKLDRFSCTKTCLFLRNCPFWIVHHNMSHQNRYGDLFR
jgi:hypothetical protein